MSLYGKVKSFNEGKGYGFIECAETHAIYAKDIFLPKRALEGTTVRPGDEVVFDAETDATGVVATNVVVHSVHASTAHGSLSSHPGNGSNGDTFVGTVKSYNDQKGWGFIDCPETHAKHGKDVFLPKRAIPGGTIGQGTRVRFAVEVEATGVVASNIQVLQAGGAAPRGGVAAAPRGGGATGGQFFGVVKSFNDGKGYGFIDCPETRAMFGKDIFLPKRELPNGQCVVGQSLTFTVVHDASGACAANVLPAIPMGTASTMAQYGGAPGMGGAFYSGTIKSFNDAKGFGMIKCEQTERMYGKDVFFSKSVNPGCAVGELVSFTTKFESKGPIVTEMWRAGRSPGSFGGAPSVYHSPQVMQAMGVADSTKTYFGTVKTWNDQKGYGHIACEATMATFNKDVFLLSGKLEGQPVEVGAELSFKVTMGAKGPQAADVTVLPPGATGTEDAPGSQFQGTVKSFNENKGYGFIAGEVVTQAFGKDIFLSKRELNDEIPAVGEELNFTVEIDKSQLVARNVKRLGSSIKAFAPAAKKKKTS